MMTTSSSKPLVHQSWEYEQPLPGGIIAGVDGSRESIAALNTAAGIARARRCALHVVTVLGPFPSYDITPGYSSTSEDRDQLRISLKESQLREIMRALNPEECWTHQVVIGRAARALTSIAERRGADLIVVGRRRHGMMDRVLGGETTLQVMRLSPTPVLAVDADLERVRTAVAAVDFSPASVHAAKDALALMGETGTLYLAHVEPPVDVLPEGFALPLQTRFPGDVVVWFRRLINELGAAPGVLVEPVMLNGKPVSALTEFAERVGADLIVAGSHGHSRMERFLLGSVSTGIVRNAAAAVLVVPPRSAPE